MDRIVIEKRIKKLEDVVAECQPIIKASRDTTKVFTNKANRAKEELAELRKILREA